jgi:hypothetical protein
VKLVPQAQVKPFKECGPGDLVRTQYRNSRLGIVATGPAGRYLIRLQDEAGSVNPIFHLRDDASKLDEEIISYGADYHIEVDHDPQSFEFGPQKLLHGGILWLAKSEWHLRVGPPKEEMGYGFFHFATGVIDGKGPVEYGSARFGKWKLCLPTNDPSTPLVMMSFSLGPTR